MYDNLARRAINAALANEWDLAREVNLTILQDSPNDADALNRLARAHMQLGDYDSAVECANKVLTIDPLNPIATRCSSKCNALKGHGLTNNNSVGTDYVFLEVPGKTKIASLINLCDNAILARLDAGCQVNMKPTAHKVTITAFENIYIGRFPDDLAMRIIYLIKNGNEYTTHIKSVTENDIKIFINEVKKAPGIAHIPSFPTRH
jgi:tetratricopeptide (TPR) repeat protein